MLRSLTLCLLLCFSHTSFAVGGTDYTTALPNDQAYQGFGGKEGLQRVMNDFMRNLLANQRTRPFFERSDQAHVKEQLVLQFCEILGGPCVYKGARMGPIHKGHSIEQADFFALVEALQVAMTQNAIPTSLQNVLLAKLAPMHRNVITQ